MSSSAIFGLLTSRETLELPDEITASIPVGDPDPKTGERKVKKETRPTMSLLVEWGYHIQCMAQMENEVRASGGRVKKGKTGRFGEIEEQLDALEPFVDEVMSRASIKCGITEERDGSQEQKLRVDGRDALLLAFGTEIGDEMAVTGEKKGDITQVIKLRVIERRDSADAQEKAATGASRGAASDTRSDGDDSSAGGKAVAEAGSAEGTASGAASR